MCVSPWVDVGETPKELPIVWGSWLCIRSLEIEVVYPIFGVVGCAKTFDERIP